MIAVATIVLHGSTILLLNVDLMVFIAKLKIKLIHFYGEQCIELIWQGENVLARISTMIHLLIRKIALYFDKFEFRYSGKNEYASTTNALVK